MVPGKEVEVGVEEGEVGPCLHQLLGQLPQDADGGGGAVDGGEGGDAALDQEAEIGEDAVEEDFFAAPHVRPGVGGEAGEDGWELAEGSDGGEGGWVGGEERLRLRQPRLPRRRQQSSQERLWEVGLGGASVDGVIHGVSESGLGRWGVEEREGRERQRRPGGSDGQRRDGLCL